MIKQIKEQAKKAGVEFKKENFRLNGSDAYTYDRKMYTLSQLKEAHKMGAL